MAALIATLVATPLSFADGIWIPGSIKVEKFKELMLERGMNLSGSDDSDGAIEQFGTKIKVVTYKPVTEEQLNLLKEVSILTLRDNG